MLDHRENANLHIIGRAEHHHAILILDPAGKLKLARWRLQSDGYRIYYVRDLSASGGYPGTEEVHLVLVNIDRAEDLELLNRWLGEKRRPEILAVTGTGSDNVIKKIYAAGVRGIVTRPLDFPKLSRIVGERLKNPQGQPLKHSFGETLVKPVPEPFHLRNVYQIILEQLKSAVLIIDSQGRVVFFNRAMSLLTGLVEAGTIGEDYRNIFIHQADQCELISCQPKASCPVACSLHVLLQSALRGMESSGHVMPATGRPVMLESKPIFTPRNVVSGAFVVSSGETDKGKIEEALANSEKLAIMGQLAAGAAHEIRNPLTSVRGFIQLLEKELEGTPKADYINIIIAEIDRVNTIINEFLKLAKPSAPNKKVMGLGELVREIFMLIDGEAFLKNINIEEDISELPLLFIDPEQVKQVVINVVRNAFEAMPQGGTLSVTARDLTEPKEICLSLSDTGIGIKEKEREKVFSPFFTTKENGTGLGLAVSSQIMEDHGGRIDIKSKAGRGTTVYLYFPYH